jgi:hypothetical protein
MNQRTNSSERKFARRAIVNSDFGMRNSDLAKDYRLQVIGYKGILSAISHILSPAPRLLVLISLLGILSSGAWAQVSVQYATNPAATIPDRGQYVSTLTIANAGIAEITGVSANVVLTSPSATNPMWLGDMFASLTHGTASESERTATVFDYFTSNPNNSATSLSASYDFPAQFDGDWLASNKWSLLVADRAQGGVGQLASWGLTITGTAASEGVIDPGQGGTISAAAAGSHGIGAIARSTGAGANGITLNTASGRTLNFTGGLEGSGDFKKTGVGTVQIGGNSPTFSGLVEVNQGDLVVNSGANLGSGSSLRVNSGGRLKGTGTVGALTVASGGRLAVGNSPGTMTAASATWQGGGIFEWELNNFLGSAGTNWDFLNVSGLLDITAISGNRFIIEVISLLPDNTTEGAIAGFDTTANYDFLIATAAGGIANFNADDFTIVTSRFSNATGSGSSGGNLWSLSTQGNSLYLSYSGGTAIPEPSSAALTLIGLGVLAWSRRRNR